MTDLHDIPRVNHSFERTVDRFLLLRCFDLHQRVHGLTSATCRLPDSPSLTVLSAIILTCVWFLSLLLHLSHFLLVLLSGVRSFPLCICPISVQSPPPCGLHKQLHDYRCKKDHLNSYSCKTVFRTRIFAALRTTLLHHLAAPPHHTRMPH